MAKLVEVGGATVTVLDDGGVLVAAPAGTDPDLKAVAEVVAEVRGHGSDDWDFAMVGMMDVWYFRQ